MSWRNRISIHSGNALTLATNRGGRRAAVVRRYALDVMKTVSPAVLSDRDGLRFLVRTRDKAVGRSTFSEGAFEIGVIEHAIGIVAEALGRCPLKSKVFVNVGANIGTTCVPAVARYDAARAVAVEPEPQNFEFLRCNTILNRLESRITCVQAAVSDVPGTVAFELSENNFGDHRVRISDASGAYNEASRQIIEVDARTLDSILAEVAVSASSVGLLWVDTQGFEGRVLNSGSDLLAAGIPAVVEYWPYALKRANNLDLFNQTVAKFFSRVVDVRHGYSIPASRVAELQEIYTGTTFTDLALIP
jgi:FkbM family methyltransferase